MKLPVLALCAALALSGCAHFGLTPAQSQTAQVVLANGQLASDVAYNVAATAYLAQAPTMAPATKATVKGILLKIYICHPPVVGDQSCAGYLKDLHDAVTDGDAAAQGNITGLIADLLAQAAKAGLK